PRVLRPQGLLAKGHRRAAEHPSVSSRFSPEKTGAGASRDDTKDRTVAGRCHIDQMRPTVRGPKIEPRRAPCAVAAAAPAVENGLDQCGIAPRSAIGPAVWAAIGSSVATAVGSAIFARSRVPSVGAGIGQPRILTRVGKVGRFLGLTAPVQEKS